MSYAPPPPNPYAESTAPYPTAYEPPPYSTPMPQPSGSGYAPPPPPGSGYATPPARSSGSGYGPQPIPTVILQPTSVYLGHNPQAMQCPSCGQSIVTRVSYDPGALAWLMALGICFFGGIFGCCLIPFCVPGCQDATHVCPACQATLGRRSPF